ncbi:PROTEIN NLP8 [Salix koriyanagi]|uniref:PROTEIN NLP8 n=1 Tax=Salix koriyanagi TaxID=2511006 RepID=A0A9Q1APT1_9ROSI|nr:PROTEIN NLP8 [Salix koriyanagi]
MDEHSSSSPNSTLGIFSGNSMNWELMDEILYQGWAENDGEFSFLQQPQTSRIIIRKKAERHCHGNPPLDYPKSMELVQTESQVEDSVVTSTSVLHSSGYRVETAGLGVEWQMAPRVIPMTSFSVKERAMHVVRYLQKFIEYKDSLIQIWLPMEREGKTVLATIDQPYFVNQSCKSLASYRNVSTAYHFQVEQDARLSSVGFPGRVFLEKLPEWTPDCNITLKGLSHSPFFNQGSETCLGIVEIVTTTLKISYRQELEDICRALKAVNLRTSEDFCSPGAKTFNGLNQGAVSEISEIVQSVCKAYRLPLALTWALCGRQGKSGRQQFSEKFGACISTVDSACFLADRDFSGFYMASSEQNIILGQGIVGRAFTAKKQCLANDITSFSKKDYPLAHLATIFGLHGAMAIPLRSISTGLVEFVLELFLPKDCRDAKEQKRMWDVLPSAIQQVCWSLQVVMDKGAA